ncbi:hypothetical protein HNY73_013827 [Argiope bruennichi]|uniref:Uncharacterized protein n=1 Tax=Argiope bruennichi TaxID=94029 RepID=A0A8T0ES92_ARGBR|nr:hypothetical protein HNY73_013827 [Argiope bruennichi]
MFPALKNLSYLAVSVRIPMLYSSDAHSLSQVFVVFTQKELLYQFGWEIDGTDLAPSVIPLFINLKEFLGVSEVMKCSKMQETPSGKGVEQGNSEVRDRINKCLSARSDCIEKEAAIGKWTSLAHEEFGMTKGPQISLSHSHLKGESQ